MKHRKTALCIGIAAAALLSAGCVKTDVTDVSCAKTDAGETGNHRLYLKKDYASEEIKAVFVNSATGDTKETVMKREADGDGFFQYACMGDTAAYNKVSFVYNGDETYELAFNELVDGWYLSSYGVLPCTEGVPFTRDIPLTQLTFSFQDNDKDVYVWTPADYKPDADQKYSVIYLFDGDRALANVDGQSGWNVPESVTSAMKQSDFQAIVVGIATPEITRYQELVPDLGKPTPGAAEEYSVRDGSAFCEFVVNTVMPAIEKQYNVYTDPAHTAIAGSSLGGLESFYIGMEHPEKFGTVGAMSSSFGIYSESSWEAYLKQKDFSRGVPFMYLYAGDDFKDNGFATRQMMTLLEQLGYPQEKRVLDLYEKGDHLMPFWRYIFPEFLEAMHTQRVAALM